MFIFISIAIAIIVLAIMFIRYPTFWINYFIQLGWVFGQVVIQLLCVPYIVLRATMGLTFDIFKHFMTRQKRH